MDPGSVPRVRLGVVTSKHCFIIGIVIVVLMSIALLAGGLGPSMFLEEFPTAPAGVALTNASQVCTNGASGAPLDPPVPRCWGWTFSFNQRWTQYFDLELVVRRPVDQPLFGLTAKLPLDVTWLGTVDPVALTGWQVIAAETVNRTVRCDEGDPVCSNVVVFSTNWVQFASYHMRVAVPNATTEAEVAYVDTVDFQFRYKNPKFAQFETGFKIFFCVVNILVLFVYFRRICARGRNACYGCLFACRTDPALQTTDGARRRGGIFSINWVAILLIGLLLYNNPLFTYEFVSPRAGLVFIEQAWQAAFVVMLLTFWLCEFGILAAKSSEDLSFRWFLLPRLLILFIYWVLTVGFYAWNIFKLTEDPLFDWYENTTQRSFLEVLGIAASVFYSTYLLFNLCSAVGKLCSKHRSEGELGLFLLHFFVLVATVAGLGGGMVYHVDVTKSLDFLWFHMLYNVYVYVLAFMYSPLPPGHPALAQAVDTRDGEDGAAADGSDSPGRKGASLRSDGEGGEGGEGGEEEEDGEGPTGVSLARRGDGRGAAVEMTPMSGIGGGGGGGGASAASSSIFTGTAATTWSATHDSAATTTAEMGAGADAGASAVVPVAAASSFLHSLSSVPGTSASSSSPLASSSAPAAATEAEAAAAVPEVAESSLYAGAEDVPESMYASAADFYEPSSAASNPFDEEEGDASAAATTTTTTTTGAAPVAADSVHVSVAGR